jgi:hypothetical protein
MGICQAQSRADTAGGRRNCLADWGIGPALHWTVVAADWLVEGCLPTDAVCQRRFGIRPRAHGVKDHPRFLISAAEADSSINRYRSGERRKYREQRVQRPAAGDDVDDVRSHRFFDTHGDIPSSRVRECPAALGAASAMLTLIDARAHSRIRRRGSADAGYRPMAESSKAGP